MAGGIEKDRYGAPVAYHVSRYHPGNQFTTGDPRACQDVFVSPTGD
jgi:capsid protein